MSNFDPRYQTEKDGSLTKSLRDRLQKFRENGATLADIGARLGFSGAFISQLLNEKRPGRIRTIHIRALVQAVEHAEIEEGIVDNPTSATKPLTNDASQLPLEDLIRAISAKGFDVTVTPRTK